MKRRSFLKFMGVAVAAPVLGTAKTEVPKEVIFPSATDDWGEFTHAVIPAKDDFYVALSDANGEISGSGYTRQKVDLGFGHDGVFNASEITFGTPVDEDTRIESLAIFDSKDNKLFISPLVNPSWVRVGDTFTILPENLNISLT